MLLIQLRYQWHITIIVVNLIEPKKTTTQIIIAVDYWKMFAHCRNELVINRNWDIVCK